MERNVEENIEKTYELIKRNIPQSKMDSLEVAKQVEEYRQF